MNSSGSKDNSGGGGIKMVDLYGQHRHIRREIDAAIANVISSSAFVRGEEVALFEKELADYLGVRNCISCGNGTDALTLSLMAIGLEPGDEVVMPAFSFAAAAEAVAFLGGVPVFADCDSASFNISIESIQRCITKRTKVLLPVHLFGFPCDMQEIMCIADDAGINVIEDNAQSLGAICEFGDKGRKYAGTIGKIGCTSFFPSKVLGALGDGGAIFTDDDSLAEHLRSLANHGQGSRYDHRIIGMNSRLDTLQAAVLRVKLRQLDRYIAERRKCAESYTSLLNGINSIIVPEGGGSHIWHQYTLKVKHGKRNALKACLEAAGIPAAVYYNKPLYDQTAYSRICRCDSSMRNAPLLSQSVLSLPIHTEMTMADCQIVTETITRFFQS